MTFIVAVAASLICVFSAPAMADYEECSAEEEIVSNREVKLAKAAETNGKTFDAYLHYRSAPCAVLKKGERGWPDMLVVMASKAEAAGRLYNKEDFYVLKPDTQCEKIQSFRRKDSEVPKNLVQYIALCEQGGDRRLEANPRASAYRWFNEADGKHEDAARVIMKAVRADPEGIEAVKEAKKAVTRTRDRDGVITKLVPNEAAYITELKGIASKNIAGFLEREDKNFNKKTIDAFSQEKSSDKLLELAHDWQKIFNNSDEASRINSRAVKRGDDLVASTTAPPYAHGLESAKKYFQIAGDHARLDKLKALAEKRGDAALATGHSSDAVQCFRIAGNSAKETRASARLKEDEKAMHKDEKSKKKFKKEADAMEKDLGI